VFNNSQIQLVSSLSLTCLPPPNTVRFILLFSFQAGARDGAIFNSAPMPGDAVRFPGWYPRSAPIPNSLFLPTAPCLAKFLKNMPERVQGCSFSRCENKATKINGAGRYLVQF